MGYLDNSKANIRNAQINLVACLEVRLGLKSKKQEPLVQLIMGMISPDPKIRPTADEAFKQLETIIRQQDFKLFNLVQKHSLNKS
jgi:hypothetical protein